MRALSEFRDKVTEESEKEPGSRTTKEGLARERGPSSRGKRARPGRGAGQKKSRVQKPNSTAQCTGMQKQVRTGLDLQEVLEHRDK